MKDFIKMRASVFGPTRRNAVLLWSRASWPFGSIKIDEEKIVFGSVFFKTSVQKNQILTIKNNEQAFANKVDIFYKENGREYQISCSSIKSGGISSALKRYGYSFS